MRRCCFPILLVLLVTTVQNTSAQDGSSRPPITRENAAGVAHLGAVGDGRIADMVWSPDGATLAVSTDQGVALYDPDNLNQQPQYLRDPVWEHLEYGPVRHDSYGGGDIVYAEDGAVLVAGHGPWLDFWDMHTNTLRGVYADGDIGAARFDYRTNLLIIGGNNINRLTLLIKDIEGVTPSGHQSPVVGHQIFNHILQRGVYVSDLALSPDGQFVALSSAVMEYRPSYDREPTMPDVLVWNVDRVNCWQVACRYLLDKSFYWTGPEPDIVLRGHTAPVRQITYNADGSLLASAGLDDTVRLWNMPEGTSRAVLYGHLAAVWDVDFSPDGAHIASVGGDGTLRLWDVQTGEQLQAIQLGITVEIVAFSPDGTRIAAAGQDGSLWLFNAETGVLLDSRRAPSPMWSVDFSPDARMVVTGDVNNRIILWDVQPETPTAVQRQVLQGHTGVVYDTVFSPDGNLIASASSDHTVRLWDVQSGAEIAVLEGHAASVYGVAFSPDGRLLASGSWDRTACLWDVATGELLHVFDSDGPVYSVAFNPDGRLLAYGDTTLWDIENNRLVARWDTRHGWSDSYASGIGKLVFSSDGHMLINGGYLYGGGSWNLDTLENTGLCGHSPVMAVHGDLQAVNALGLCDLTNGQWLTDPNGDDPRHTTQLPRDIAFSPDGTLIVTVGTDSKLHFWGVSDHPTPATEAE